MKMISREELKQKLDCKDNFRLVMALGEWEYQAKHIPGSLHFASMREALASLKEEDEIVVYCSDETLHLVQLLRENACIFQAVKRTSNRRVPCPAQFPPERRPCQRER